jgi:hypothetical protein
MAKKKPDKSELDDLPGDVLDAVESAGDAVESAGAAVANPPRPQPRERKPGEDVPDWVLRVEAEKCWDSCKFKLNAPYLKARFPRGVATRKELMMHHFAVGMLARSGAITLIHDSHAGSAPQ